MMIVMMLVLMLQKTKPITLNLFAKSISPNPSPKQSPKLKSPKRPGKNHFISSASSQITGPTSESVDVQEISSAAVQSQSAQRTREPRLCTCKQNARYNPSSDESEESGNSNPRKRRKIGQPKASQEVVARKKK